MQGSAKLKTHLRRYDDTATLVQQYFKAETTLQNIMSATGTALMRYGPIASAWTKADESISLEEWGRGEFVLVLGNSETCRSAMDAINQALFRRASQILLSQSESSSRRSWIFLDEVREAKLEGLSRLLTQGRSKGVCVAIAFQDIDGLRDLYGERVANEIVGQCSSKAILRLASPATARWASEVIGEREGFEYPQGEGGSEQLVKRDGALASEFFAIPPTNHQNGLTGLYVTAEYGTYRSTLSGRFLDRALKNSNSIRKQAASAAIDETKSSITTEDTNSIDTRDQVAAPEIKPQRMLPMPIRALPRFTLSDLQ